MRVRSLSNNCFPAGDLTELQSLPRTDWAPVTRAVTDAAEVTAEWLSAHRSEVRVVDVREREDFNDEMGHIPARAKIHMPITLIVLRSFRTQRTFR